MRTINTHMKSPCSNCPFRKDVMRGWLGEERMDEIIRSSSFVCHKTTQGEDKDLKQCAGHMILADYSTYVELSEKLNIDLQLKGKELVFDTSEECIEAHKNR